ncbi:protein of unknown function [Serratia sp. Tan611]|nr:protein of unknown function [Serratia sp. Tan611]
MICHQSPSASTGVTSAFLAKIAQATEKIRCPSAVMLVAIPTGKLVIYPVYGDFPSNGIGDAVTNCLFYSALQRVECFCVRSILLSRQRYAGRQPCASR